MSTTDFMQAVEAAQDRATLEPGSVAALREAFRLVTGDEVIDRGRGVNNYRVYTRDGGSGSGLTEHEALLCLLRMAVAR